MQYYLKKLLITNTNADDNLPPLKLSLCNLLFLFYIVTVLLRYFNQAAPAYFLLGYNRRNYFQSVTPHILLAIGFMMINIMTDCCEWLLTCIRTPITGDECPISAPIQHRFNY